jgi:hypothetical protein
MLPGFVLRQKKYGPPHAIVSVFTSRIQSWTYARQSSVKKHNTKNPPRIRLGIIAAAASLKMKSAPILGERVVKKPTLFLIQNVSEYHVSRPFQRLQVILGHDHLFQRRNSIRQNVVIFEDSLCNKPADQGDRGN